MSTPYNRETMRRILSAAQAGVRKFASHTLPATHDTHTLSLPQLSLSLPEPLNRQLIGLGVDDSAAGRISDAVTRAVTRLKAIFEDDFKRRCKELQVQMRYFDDPKFLTIFPATYSTIYLKTVDSWSSHILHQFIPRFLRAQQGYKRRDALTSGRRPFNQNAVPLLERSFSQNVFPSRLEKYELASASQMEYRQVHVWFQNRRSRLRKEGKELKRPQQSHVLLEQLENGVADALIPESSEDEDGIDSTEETIHDSLFHANAPPHAFPAPYPAICSYDPFPVVPEKRKLDLPWLRTLRSCTSPRGPSPDMDDLTSHFSAMTISDPDPTGQSSPSHLRGHSLSQGCIVGFTTPCSRAPHPALLRRPRRSGRSPCPSICTTVSGAPSSKTASDRHHVLHVAHASSDAGRRSLSSDPTPGSFATSTPPHVLSNNPPRRKKLALPRRIPKHPPVQHLSMQLPSSPTPSCTSTTSRSSSSTLLSDVDSPLNTPTLSHSTLHALAVLPYWVSASDFLSLPVGKVQSVVPDSVLQPVEFLTSYA